MKKCLKHGSNHKDLFHILLLHPVYIYVYICIYVNKYLKYTLSLLIGLVVRVFANGPGDLGSILTHVITKTLKMVLDTYLLNTQQ